MFRGSVKKKPGIVFFQVRSNMCRIVFKLAHQSNIMNFLIRLLVSTIAVILSAYILPGVSVDSFITAIIVAIILSLLNVIVKPILVVLTIPFTIFTLGLFLLVINAIIILMTDWIIDGFTVDGFWYALLFSIVLSLLNSLLGGSSE